MNSAGRSNISSIFQHGVQDDYLSLNPHVKGGLFPLSLQSRERTAPGRKWLIFRLYRGAKQSDDGWSHTTPHHTLPGPRLLLPDASAAQRQSPGGWLYGRTYTQGRTQGEGPPPPPWNLKNTIFSGFLPLNYVIYIFEVCFFMLFCYVGGLRKPAAW